MERVYIHPHDPGQDSTLSFHERQVFHSLLSAIFAELPATPSTWKAALALGLSQCVGLSIAEMARAARCSEDALIHGAVAFAAAIRVQASPHLRSVIRARIASGDIEIKS